MANISSIGGNPIVPAAVQNDTITDAMLAQTGGVLSSVDEISQSNVVNLIDISSETYLYSTDSSVSVTYDDGVAITFTNTANPQVRWALGGLTAGKNYVLTFDLVSGSIASANGQRVIVTSNDGRQFISTVASSTVVDSTYTIQFTPTSVANLALEIALIYSSKSVTLGNFSLVDSDARRTVRNDAVVGLPESSLSDELQAKINAANITTAYGTDANLVDPNDLTAGYINGSTGEVTATGSAMSVTGYIPLEAGTPYYWHNIINGYWAFYDSQSVDGYISGLGYQDGSTDGYFQTPDGTAYGRFTVQNANASTAWINSRGAEPTGDTLYALNANIKTQGEHPTNPCDYTGREVCIFHKCVCVGDSLTQGVCNYNEGGTPVVNVTFPNYSYPTYLAKLTGCEVTNKGTAGRTTAQWYAEHANDDLSGYDFAIIQLGVNDAIANRGWSAEQETAMDNIIGKLQEENNNIKIFVATIIPAISYRGTIYDDVSDGLRTYVEGLADGDVILLDMAEHGHTGEELAYNAGHLTAYGYMTLAKDYMAYISWHIANNKMDFRQVQFIGTDHSYS